MENFTVVHSTWFTLFFLFSKNSHSEHLLFFEEQTEM